MAAARADGGWENWQWDETLFGGAASYYELGRLPYAVGLADAIAETLRLDGHGRLLDVGCGPGTIALRLAHLFEAVVGLDPDPGMVDEAKRLVIERRVANVTWIQLRAEELPAGLGIFRVVTFAASFHWMDRVRVAKAVGSMLVPEGAVVQIDAPAYRSDSDTASVAAPPAGYPTPPEQALVELRRKYLGVDKRAGQGVRNTSPEGEDEIFQSAGFAPAQRVVVPDGRVLERTIDELVANTFSSSATAPHLFGDRLGDYEAELRGLLREASPPGLFSVRLPDNRLSVWKRDRTGQSE